MPTHHDDAACNRAWERFAVALVLADVGEDRAKAISDAALEYALARARARESLGAEYHQLERMYGAVSRANESWAKKYHALLADFQRLCYSALNINDQLQLHVDHAEFAGSMNDVQTFRELVNDLHNEHADKFTDDILEEDATDHDQLVAALAASRCYVRAALDYGGMSPVGHEYAAKTLAAVDAALAAASPPKPKLTEHADAPHE